MRKSIERLLNSNLSSQHISDETGISTSVISRLRKGERSISNLSLESAEKLFNYQNGVDNMSYYEKEYILLKAKVDCNKCDDSVSFYRGHLMSFRNDNLTIIVDFEQGTVTAYVEVNFMRYGEKVTSFGSIQDLYDILYFDYKKYFSTDSLASKTMVWIKQMFLMNK